MGGVTRTLNISYLRAVPIGKSGALFVDQSPLQPVENGIGYMPINYVTGTKIHIHSEVTQAGRTMAMIRGVMQSPDGKTTYCTCEHHKVSVPTQKEHLTYRVGWDEVWQAEVEPTSFEGKSRL